MKSNRQGSFRSAREFSQKHNLGISYPQYSRYEAGEQLPNLDQAIKLFDLLNIPIMTGLVIWCQAQVENGSTAGRLGNLAMPPQTSVQAELHV